jgi:hypothetical protein
MTQDTQDIELQMAAEEEEASNAHLFVDSAEAQVFTG